MAGFFESLGRRFVKRRRDFFESLAIFGEICCRLVETLAVPKRFRFADFALAFERAGFEGLAISTMIGFLLGLILAFESAASLRTFGVEVYVADLVAIGLFRELGPLVTAIVLAGRSGSAFAAEIGTMKVDEELDALTTMALPPVRFLVIPRVLAAMLAMPFLTVAAEAAGLVGGAIVLEFMDVPASVYWKHVASSTASYVFLMGLAKAALFGLIVGIVGCIAGLKTRNTADGVGVSTTAAVVNGIVAVALADGIIAVLCCVFGI